MDPRTPKPPRHPPPWDALATTAAGTLGLLPSTRGAGDPIAFATWLALAAPALGLLAGARRSRWMLLLPPAFWVALLLACGSHARLPQPALAGVAVAALYALGALLGALRRPPALAEAAFALLVTGFLAALPASAGRLAEPWPPAVAARLLDLSPEGFVLESGGIDWMRTPEVYEAVDSSSIGPELRRPWTGSRAAPLLLAIGYAGVFALWSLRGRGRDA